MFNKQIVASDAFLDMPDSSQLLYFHLNMHADDDGFVGSPKRILRMLGKNDDDLKILIINRFLLTFQSGVIVVKHWKIHNTIQKDRNTPTGDLEEAKLIKVKKNRAYTDDLELGNILETNMSHRVEKSRVEKSRLEEIKKKNPLKNF